MNQVAVGSMPGDTIEWPVIEAFARSGEARHQTGAHTART